MKQSIFLQGFVCALVVLPLAAGCKKKEDAAKGGSAAPTAGSAAAGSAAAGSTAAGSAAAGSAAAGSAAASGVPWATDTAVVPANSKLTGKRDGSDQGTFDRAVYYKTTDKSGSSTYQLEIVSNCEKFNCAHFDENVSSRMGSFWSDCPSAKIMEVKLKGDADPKAGPVDVDIYINGSSSGGGLMSGWTSAGTITEVSDKEIKGKIDFKDKDGKNEVKGEFAAKVCGTYVAK